MAVIVMFPPLSRPTGTRYAMIAAMSSALVPGGNSAVVVTDPSRWIDQSSMLWSER